MRFQLKNIRYLILFFCFCNNVNLLAQEAPAFNRIERSVFYNKYNIADFLSEGSKWRWEFDIYYRRQSGPENEGPPIQYPLRLSFRPWMSYQLTKFTRLSVSPIGLINSAPRFENDAAFDLPIDRELRSTFQINHNSYFDRFNFTHRLRYESRWRYFDEINDVFINHNHRIRYRLRTRIPLNFNYFYINNTVYLNAYSEVHFQFGSQYGLNVFSQNRNYIGIGYRFWDWMRIEAGYVHQNDFAANMVDLYVSRGVLLYLYIDYFSKLRKSY